MNPVGSIRQFVTDFVKRIFDHAQMQEVISLRKVFRKTRTTGYRFPVVFQEHRLHLACDIKEERRLWCIEPQPADFRGTGVVEGSKHSCNVADWQILAAPLDQRPHRLTLKVDNED